MSLLKSPRSTIRYLPGAIEYSKAGAHSGGLHNNRDFVESCVEMDAPFPPKSKLFFTIRKLPADF